MGHYYAEMAGLTDSPKDEELHDAVSDGVDGVARCCEQHTKVVAGLVERNKDLQARIKELNQELSIARRRQRFHWGSLR